MAEHVQEANQGAVLALTELDGFARRLAEWNRLNQDARASADARCPKHPCGLPPDLATQWLTRATLRSAELVQSIRSLERELARQQRKLLEARQLERQCATAAISVVMQRLGITLQDVVGEEMMEVAHPSGEQRRPTARLRVPVIGPQGQVWLGNGRRPKWMKEFIATGGHVDDLLASRILDSAD
ncbi:H-NS histone family protein [Pelomonas sp. UHG3]|uniref:H-NS histone family protein n=1 Tax=Roseateles hydrophilus TaxID=2975054 RepID=A0ACC6CBC1_9BURK|nr:H-NS histone family protein [Pelomonas sp. UHG3]MCY4745680.1 H-NS histone family protein [Pelomonas sp. UHG3]